jgi:hypothetical protein
MKTLTISAAIVFIAGVFWGAYIQHTVTPVKRVFLEKSDSQPDTLTTLIHELAPASHIPIPLVRALFKQESGMDETNTAISSAGALGVGQVMPIHVKTCNLRHWSDLVGQKNLRENVSCSLTVLKECITSAGSVRGGLACYYAGPRYAQKGPEIRQAALKYADSVIGKLAEEEYASIAGYFKGS